MTSTIARWTVGLILLTLVGYSHAGKIYKWIDAQGNVQFSQTPPPAQQVIETIQLRETQPAADAPTTAEDAQAAAESSQPNDPAARWEQAQQKNCQIARDNLQRLQSDQRLAIKEGEEVREITEAERAERLDKARRHVDIYCK